MESHLSEAERAEFRQRKERQDQGGRQGRMALQPL